MGPLLAVWSILSMSLLSTFLAMLVYLIYQSTKHKLSPPKIAYLVLFSLLFQFVSVALIANYETKAKSIYFIMEFVSIVPMMTAAIMMLLGIIHDLSKLQTLSNISLFKLVCAVFIALDIAGRVYFILYMIDGAAINKWIFGLLMAWLATFVVLSVLLLMIRSESMQFFNYMKDIMDDTRKTIIFQQIWRLNVMCICFIVFAVLIFVQMALEIFGDSYRPIFYFLGIYNQWLLANPIVNIGVLYNLKCIVFTQIEHTNDAHHQQHRNRSAFKSRLLDNAYDENTRSL
mmetsp:Transcript_20818/g.33193  ORF Transcript_20818/g.33193 Transcript_20818/m.33193 type:complete len:287 (+) Transcript_20818:78-938(+)